MVTENISIKEDFIKLSQLLKYSGAVSSGSDAGELIRQGEIKVNGEICRQRGKKVHVGDIVILPGGKELLVTKRSG